MGQTQFLATNYARFAVDFDGNGRRDLIGSIPDVLASTANYLRSYGWRAGEPWDEGTHNAAALWRALRAEGFPGLTRGSEMLEVFPPINLPAGGFIRSRSTPSIR